MSIRIKIILILVPLIVFVLILTGTISALTTRSGLIRVAIQSFAFKSNQFEQYINDQWTLLEDNNLTEEESFIMSFQDSLLAHAQSLLSDDEEIILSINNKEKDIIFNTNVDSEISKEEIKSLISIIMTQMKKQVPSSPPNTDINNIPTETLTQDATIISTPRAWIKSSFLLNDIKYLGYYFSFAPQDMTLLVAITEKAFFQSVREIIFFTAILILVTIIISSIIILLFSNSLVNPLQSMVTSMHRIIESNQFDERVEVKFQDEIGQLSQTFNVMVAELDKAYQQIKQYAFSAVLSKKNESKIRNIFQKYVPVNVINSLFKDPSRLLTGENRDLALMFTDIRRFTTISETYTPEQLVQVLNSYFEQLVDIITNHEGIIDKYIGDAIMAFFGAPVEIENCSLAAMTAANKMIVAIDNFNDSLLKKKLPQFITGIGINFGPVTVGNIGSEKKMDYTAIGDAVNLGSRLEGLTKQYQQTVIFSSSVHEHVHDVVPCRIVDIVQVKGKTIGEKIYTSSPYVNNKLIELYGTHNEATELYLAQDFQHAITKFKKVQKIIHDDFLAHMYIERCEQFIKHPPNKKWDGTFIMTTK